MDISVITVCFDSGKTIKRTMDSILKQTYDRFEYIIIDGGSSDDTMAFIREYEMYFMERDIPFIYISEPDQGLYDAMNKGAAIATGGYLVYMNADDEFADDHCLSTAAEYLDGHIDVLYGDSIIVDKRSEKIRTAKPIDTIIRHLPFIPQSSFIKATTQRKYKFDLKYKISADYDSFLSMYMGGCIFRQIRYIFSRFYWGGVSNKNEWETYKEDIEIKHVHGILNKLSLVQLIKYIRKYACVYLSKQNHQIKEFVGMQDRYG